MVIQTIQRVATEHAIENSVTVFNIDNDDVKGRVIGREGRNIRALEAATGIEIIVEPHHSAVERLERIAPVGPGGTARRREHDHRPQHR